MKRLLILLLFLLPSYSTMALAPLGLEDLNSGVYFISGLFKTLPSGEDHLFVYPESVREFDVRLFHLTPAESLDFDGVKGTFKVKVEKVGTQWANVTFLSFRGPADLEKLYSSPVEMISTKE